MVKTVGGIRIDTQREKTATQTGNTGLGGTTRRLKHADTIAMTRSGARGADGILLRGAGTGRIGVIEIVTGRRIGVAMRTATTMTAGRTATGIDDMPVRSRQTAVSGDTATSKTEGGATGIGAEADRHGGTKTRPGRLSQEMISV